MSDDGLADLRALATESGHLFDARDPVQSVVVYVPMRATEELGNAAHLFETDDKGIPRFMRLGPNDRRIALCAYSPVVWIENHLFAPHQLRFYLVGADQRGNEDARRRARLFDGLAERCCAAACPTEDAPAGPSEPPSYPAFEPYRVARWTYWLHVHAWRRVIGSLVAPRQTALLGTDQRFGPAWFPVETSIASGNAEPTKAGELDLERGWFSHLTTDVFEATRLVLERVIGSIERHSEKAKRVQAGRAATAAMAGGVIPDTSPLPVDPHADELRTTPATDFDEAPPALTPNQTLVIGTMVRFDGSRLLSTATIEEAMDHSQRLSDRTIGLIVRRLIELTLAERPGGERSGARLTTKGRRLAPKVAD